MRKKFPGRMTYRQWKRTPYRKKHRLLGLTLNSKVFRSLARLRRRALPPRPQMPGS